MQVNQTGRQDRTGPTGRNARFLFVAQLLAVGSIIALACRIRYLHLIDTMRRQYLEEHGQLDIPEALYFDGKAASAVVLVALVWLVLQLTSLGMFCLNQRDAGKPVKFVFWTLWLAACGLWLV
jgi:hypothetical protein